ncbi:NBS-LRR type disease resistance protein, partial [Trifolium medium]|nr:NBS-LRR type disease resistance protein [Trifolium medium]
ASASAISTRFGDAFLSAPIQTMIDKLSSTEFLDYTDHKKLNISLLQTTLLALAPVLDDAEKKQFKNQNVRHWLDGLKDAIYDAEDLLNQISYDSLRCKVTNQVRNFLSSPFNTNRDINSQIEKLCERLQHFAHMKETLGLQTAASQEVFGRVPSTSLVRESVIVGRKDDKKKLIKMLLSDRDTDNNDIGVVAILGLGGLGKTTLAQLLYNDIEVRNHFDLKAWVCVSEDFNILRVTKHLLEGITSRTWDSNDLDILQAELKQILRNKRFLFVLDDVWNDDYYELVTSFAGKYGSKVIITTRVQTVAEVGRASHIYKLNLLSDEDCWSLISKCAFESEGFHGDEYPTLEAIGRRIARKCQGLPLAAKALGALLHFNRDAKHWNEILYCDIWELQGDNGVLPALRLSYLYLPSDLKRCFAYCSIFPKDYPLDRKQLVLLWIAEGFIENSLGMKEAEEIGDEFFGELISRSLIQQSNDDVDGKFFAMHDLVSDLTTFISGASCCRLELV